MVKKVLFVILIFILIYTLNSEKSYNQENILIASSIPQSGALKDWGESVFETTNSYFKYVNDNKLIENRKIFFKALDDKYEPDLSYENIHKLSNENILAFYGIVGTPTNSRVISIIKESQIPYFAPFSGASFLRDSDFSNIVNFRASYKQEIQSLVDYVVNKKGLNKIAIFYQNDEYGEEGYISTLEVLKNKNISFISTGTYKRNTLSINHAFNEIKNSKPEVVIMIGASKASSLFIQKAKDEKIFQDTIFCNISFSDANSIVKELEASNTNTKNLIFSQIVPNYDDKSLKIVQEYQNIMNNYSNNLEFGFISFEAFLASKILVDAIVKNIDNLSKKNFINSLKDPSKDILHEIKLEFKNSQLLNKIYLYEYKNGKFKEIVK